ncbi:MAG: shikimate kinase [Phycisphaera sp.]|nr:shikimate kinase [Phycisphaera sp.]
MITLSLMNVVLFGYRGSGKSTVGRLLADRLGVPFVDTDEMVRGRFAGLTIAQIWQIHGEPAFRAAECDVTADLLRDDNRMVIALGGGTVMQPDARAAVTDARHALRVYLRGTPDTLHARIHGDATTPTERPNLTALGGGVDEIRAVLADRSPTYEAVADHVIDIDTLTPQQITDRIAAMID